MDDLPEYDEHGGGDGTGGRRCEGTKKGEDSNGQSCPARVYTQGGYKDGNKTGACAGQEKGEHPVRGYLDKRECRDDVCWQGNLRFAS